MNPALTVFRRELLSAPRRKWFYSARMVFLILAGAVVIWGLAVAQGTRGSGLGRMLFEPLALCALPLLLLNAVNVSASVIQREKQDRTLGLLLLTDVSASSFLFGKILSSLFSVTMLMLGFLPVCLLVVSLGGVSSLQVLTTFGVLLTTIVLGIGMGMLAASIANKPNHIAGLAGLIVVGYFVFLPLWLIGQAQVKNLPMPSTWLNLVSPIGTLSSVVVSGGSLPKALPNMVLNTGLGLFLLWLAAILLPRRAISRESPPRSWPWLKTLGRRGAGRKWLPPMPDGVNPVAWKDLHVFHDGPWGIVFKWLTASILFLALAGAGWIYTTHASDPGTPIPWHELGWVLVATEGLFCAVVFALGSVSHAGLAFGRERQGRTLEILLLTDLTDRELYLGKSWAAILSVLPWLFAMLICALALSIHVRPTSNDFEPLSYIALECISMWYGYTALSFWLSLREKRNVGFGVSLLVFVLWNVPVRFLLVYSFYQHMRTLDGMVAVDVLFHLVLGTFCLQRVGTSLRRYALAENP